MHQTETGRPVTDAVVQEICKLRPDMIGLSLRDCIEVDVQWLIRGSNTACRARMQRDCNTFARSLTGGALPDAMPYGKF